MSTPAKKERLHFLDGLRGIAAAMLVIYHCSTSNIVRMIDHFKIPFLGWAYQSFTQSGVALFFVLSGVVLMRPYLRKERKFKTGSYFVRRARRIFPPYLVALAFGALVVWFNNQYPTWYNEKGMRAQFSWWETIKQAGIINLDGSYYNLAWWSLGIEMVFYLLVPVIIFVFPSKLSNTKVVIMIAATLAAALGLQLFLDHSYPQIYSATHVVPSSYRFIEYPVCFLMGVLLAMRDFKLKDAYILIASGGVLIFASRVYLPILHSGYGLFHAGVLVLAFNIKSFGRFLSKPGMIWLGERSYSLFLIHFSVFYFVDNMVSRITPGRNAMYFILTRGVGVPLAILAAMLVFHFVERREARGLITGNQFWPWQAKMPHEPEAPAKEAKHEEAKAMETVA